MSTQGLACDNLIAVELVTADGEVLEVTDESHPDLMWALRGGGGNFGVAASLTYRLRPLPMVVGGLIAHPFEAAAGHAAVLPRRGGDLPRRADRRSPGWCTRRTAPGMKLAAMIVCHTGPRARPTPTWRRSWHSARRWWSRSGRCPIR